MLIALTGIVYITFSAFSADNCAQMDSGTELCIDSFTPDNGSTNGGTWMTITGSGFPKSKTSDYVTSGLVAHWDGINNLGTGDQNHSSDSNTWTDLSSSRVTLTRADSGAGSWTDTGYKSGVNSANSAFMLNSVPDTFPIGNENRTVEVIFRTPSDWTLRTDSAQRRIFGYGGDTNKTGKFGLK
jgi:hypothetical protein